MEVLPGKKSYIAGLIAIGYGVFGLASGYLAPDDGLQAIWAGFTTIAMRMGLSKRDV